MPVGMQTLRIGINSQVLLLGALISHYLGGGSFVATHQLVLMSALVSILLFAFKGKFLAGPSLALVILLTQSASHILMGGMSNSNLTMLLTHFTGGLITYWLVQRSENIWENLLKVILQFTATIYSWTLATPTTLFNNGTPYFANLQSYLTCGAHARRGPPTRNNERS